MISTSTGFKTAIRSSSRRIKARLIFPDKTIEDVDLIEIDSYLTDEEDFLIGTANMDAAKIEISDDPLNPIFYDFNGKEADIQLGITLSDSSLEYHSIGKYTVEKSDRKNSKIYLELVDRMHKADIDYTSSLSYPATLSQILASAASQAGIVIDSTTFLNSDHIVNEEPVYEGITCRQVFAYIAELAGGYARINRLGQLTILSLGSLSAVNITGDHYIDWKKSEAAPGIIDKLIIKNGEESASSGTGTNIYTIVDNIFVSNPGSIVDNVFSSISTVNYKAGELNWIGDFSLDVGDKVTVDGEETYILNRKLKYTGGLRETVKIPGKSNIEKNSTGKPNTNLEIRDIKTKIKIISGEIEQVVTNSVSKTEWQQTIDGFNQSVSSIEEDIQNIELTPGPQGPQGEPGSNGVSVTNTDVMYYLSSAATALSGGNWSTTAPEWVNGKFIWTKTVTSYSNGSTTESNPVNITGAKGEIGSQGPQGPQGATGAQGPKGDIGTSVVSVEEYYLATSAATGVTSSTPGWTAAMQSMTTTKKYLWNYEVINFSDGSSSPTIPVVIGVYGNTGNTGATGRALTGVTEHYLASALTYGVTRSTPGWTTVMQVTTPEKPYLWNYETLTWSVAPTTTYVEPIVIGIHGSKGDVGTGVESITEEYYLSTSKTDQTNGSWVTTPPVWESGKYIWTRSKIIYSNPVSTVYTTPVVSSEWEAVNELENVMLNRFSSNETDIHQNASDIELRALKTEVEGKIFKQSTAPAHEAGRLWLNTGVSPNQLKRSTGSAWVNVTPTSGAEIGLSDSQITQKVESNSTTLAKKADVKLVDDAWKAEFGSMIIGPRNLLDGTSATEEHEVPLGSYTGNAYPIMYLSQKGIRHGDPITARVYIRSPYTFGAAVRLSFYNPDDTYSSAVGNMIAGGNEGYSTVTATVPEGCNRVVFLLQNQNAGGESSNQFIKEAKVELGTRYTPWSPSPDELFAGVTKIDRNGINVAVSDSEINTQLSHDGLSVRDGENTLASFGDVGANIPIATIGELINDTVAKIQVSNLTVTVGSGGDFSSITQAIDTIFGNGKIMMKDSSLTINLISNISEVANIRGIHGGTITINLMGYTWNGRLDARDCTARIDVIGAGVIKADGSNYPIYAMNCSLVRVLYLTADAQGYTACTIAIYGTTMLIGGCDFINSTYSMRSYRGATLMAYDNKGNCSSRAFRLDQGTVFVSGTCPVGATGTAYNDNGWFVANGTLTPTNSSYSPPPVTSETFVQTFTSATFDTLVHGTTTVDSYYGATATQNRWDSSMGWKDGRVRMSDAIYNFFNGGSNISIKYRLRRKNSTHGSSSAVKPAPYNHSASFSTGALRGGWTSWATVPSSLFTSSGATLTFYNGVQGSSGYAIWDSIEVEVTVTKQV